MFPLESPDLAESILAKAKIARPEIAWEIKQRGGFYTVREKR